jgi:hypothetical protein
MDFGSEGFGAKGAELKGPNKELNSERPIAFRRLLNVAERCFGRREGVNPWHFCGRGFLCRQRSYWPGSTRIVGQSNHRLRAAARRAEGDDARNQSGAKMVGHVGQIPAPADFQDEDELLDQLFNSSEKRLARVLLPMARFGKEGVPEMLVPRMTKKP